MKYRLYTDGACQPNPGKGGWAFILLDDERKIIEQGYEPSTTNNRMELFAVLQGLRCFGHLAAEDDQLLLRSDSQYLINGIRSWSSNWAKRGWKKKDGKPVLNDDIWKDIREWADKLDIEYEHVKGHSGNIYNEMVDKLAVEMIKKHGK